MSVVASVHIDAPVERVFDFVRDPRNWQTLPHSGFDSLDAKFTKEGLGSHFDWKVKLAGLSVGGFDVVTDYVPNRRITYESSASFVGSWGCSVNREGSGTKLTLEMRPRFVWSMPILGDLWAEFVKRSHERVIAELKASLETKPAVAA